MFGQGSRNGTGIFGKRNGNARNSAAPNIPLAKPDPADTKAAGTVQSPQAPSLSQSALFATADTELVYYLTVERPEGSYSELQELPEEERYPGTGALLARPSSQRAQLFVHICDLLEQYRQHESTDRESAAPFKPMSNRAGVLRNHLFRPQQRDYTLAELVAMSAHFGFIVSHHAAITYCSKTAFEAYEKQPGPESKALLEKLCGEEAERHCLSNKSYETSLTTLALIEKAHAALGNTPGTHRLSQMRIAEAAPYIAEIERLIANCPPALLPYFRLLADIGYPDAAAAGTRKADLELLREDLQSQVPVEKGRIFFSILELADAVGQSPLTKQAPELGYVLVRPAQVLQSLESSLRALASELARKKLVFAPEGAVELLRTCATDKLDLGQGYRSLPPQFWKSLGNSLPKSNGEVRQLITSATRLGKKRQDALLEMAGFGDGEITLEDVADTYFKLFLEAHQTLVDAMSKGARCMPASGGGVFGRLFSSTPTFGKIDEWHSLQSIHGPLRSLLKALPSACYLNADISGLPNLLADLRETSRAFIARHKGAQAVPETIDDANALAKSLNYPDPVIVTAWNLTELMRAERLVDCFDTFSPVEHEALAEFVTRLHPLPESAKPSAKWLENIADGTPDDLVEKLLTVIAPESNKNDEIIVAAVFATARMPGIGTDMLERIVESGFEDAPNGKRHERLANAALWVLSQRRGEASISAMKRIAETCRFITGRNQAAKYLAEMVTGDVDDPVMSGELRLPTLNIWPDARREPLADGSAVFAYNAPDRIALGWHMSDGNVAANPSAAMKSADATGIKRFKKLVGSLDRTLQTHIRWIERLYLCDVSFRFDEWQDRYASHETRGALSQALVWLAKAQDGRVFSFMPSKGVFVGADGQTVDPTACAISLWHPVDEPHAVASWRTYLVENAIVQPFAQAFRNTMGVDDFDAALAFFTGARVADKWDFDFNRHVAALGWVAAKKLDARKEETVKLHFFDPVSRLYVETSLTPSRIKRDNTWNDWRGFVTGPVELALGDLGATPTKSGPAKKKPTEPAELNAVQRAEIVRLLHGIIAHAYAGSVEEDLPPFIRRPVLPEVPDTKPVSDERVAAIGAYASLLADPHAASNWRNKDKGEPRIAVRDDGRLLVNGMKNSYIFCPVEGECYGLEDNKHWTCNVRDGHRDSACNVPFGMDSVLRDMTAKIHLMTKDDRPGNATLKTGTIY